jgi:hypothetical protein
MANKRIFYAIHQVGFALDGTQTFIAAHGVQSVGITTNFNLEQVFELGQLSIYQNIENIPDIEVTMEKVLDGYPLLYHLATNGSTSGSLTGRSNVKTTVGLSIFADTFESASGAPIAEVRMSGMFVSSLSYTFPVDGNCTESVTLVGNSKLWVDVEGGGTAAFSGAFNNNDLPFAINGSGGVQRRYNVMFTPAAGPGTPPAPALDVNGMTNQWMTVLPTDIFGVTSSGTNPTAADGTLTVPVQSITISADLGREQIFELGRKSPYFRYITFPVEVRTEIEVLACKWDGISADEAGGNNGAPAGSNLKNQTIRVRMMDGTMVDVGKKNKLSSVAYNGGDAGGGGGNVTNRYSYITYNDLLVTHPMDPSAL